MTYQEKIMVQMDHDLPTWYLDMATDASLKEHAAARTDADRQRVEQNMRDSAFRVGHYFINAALSVGEVILPHPT